MSFIESQFPTTIGYGSSGGPQYSTTIVQSKSGYEQRNVNWSLPRHKYNAAAGVQSLDDLAAMIDFFHACQGSAYGFRFKDWADFKSCVPSATPVNDDQTIGTGDGVETDFQLAKAYAAGSQTLTRNITKPVNGTVLIAVDGVAQTETTHYTIDYTTGIVTFVTAPADTLEVTAGFEFDVPVRFDADNLVLTHEAWKNGTLSLPLIEIRV